MENTFQYILDKLPYEAPFLFVDILTELSETHVEGYYTFKKEEFFYGGHFKGNPVTPGVILTECMAQIGLVCLGIYLLTKESSFEEKNLQIALSEMNVQYFKKVLPGERVKVVSKKKYFRFGKLKCEVAMFNQNEACVCKGTLSGVLISENNGNKE